MSVRNAKGHVRRTVFHDPLLSALCERTLEGSQKLDCMPNVPHVPFLVEATARQLEGYRREVRHEGEGVRHCPPMVGLDGVQLRSHDVMPSIVDAKAQLDDGYFIGNNTREPRLDDPRDGGLGYWHRCRVVAQKAVYKHFQDESVQLAACTKMFKHNRLGCRHWSNTSIQDQNGEGRERPRRYSPASCARKLR